MKTLGITWNAIVTDQLAERVALFKETFGTTTMAEFPGLARFPQDNGGILEVYAQDGTPPLGHHQGIVFGFRAEDIEVASAELASSRGELLGATHRLDNGYAHRFFRGPDGQVHDLNEHRKRAHATE